MSNSVDAYKDKIKRIAELEEEWDSLEKKKKTVNDELDRLRYEVMKMLKSDNLDFMDTEHGRLSYYERVGVKMPTDPKSKRELFDYIEREGLFDDLVSIHPGKLTSFYKAQADEAKANGNPFFSMPGIEEITRTDLPRFTPPKKG